MEILNFALLLEYVEDGFYTDALDKGALDGELLEFARAVGEHEKAHIELLQEALGEAARERPTFDFGNATSQPDRFGEAARSLEETGTAAYIGQGANLTAPVAVTAGRIASVEARHTAWITDILGRHPAPHAADPALSQEQVSRKIDKTGFVTS
jgi:hypothetical protein